MLRAKADPGRLDGHQAAWFIRLALSARPSADFNVLPPSTTLRAGFDRIGHIIGVAHRCGVVEELVGAGRWLQRRVYEV